VTAVATLDRPSADPPPVSGSVVRSGAAVPLALALLAAIVRLPTMAQQSFWLDEAYTVRLVRMSFGGMLHQIPITESTPPVYYALAWVWTRVFGSAEFGLRSLSAAAGILTVVVVYFIGVRIAGRTAGVIAGVLVALAPLMIWYSQEARAYALGTLLSAATILCFIGFLQDRDARWLVGWAASSALGLATHYFVVFVVAPELVWLLWRFHRDRRVLVAIAPVVAVGIALVPLALAQRGTGHADYIAVGGLGTRILQVPKQFLIGYASPAQIATGVVAAALVLGGGIWALVRAARGRSWGDRAVLIPLGLGIIALLLPALLALVGVDFLNTRNLLPALPPLLVVVACGFAASGAAAAGAGATAAGTGAPEAVAVGRSGGARAAAAADHGAGGVAPVRAGLLAAGALSLVFIAVLVLVDTNPRYQRDDWRGVSQALGAVETPRAIVLSPASGAIPLAIYQPGLTPVHGPTTISELDIVAGPNNRAGQRIGAPPHPGPRLKVPPGFTFYDSTLASTYAVIRYRAAKPQTVRLRQLLSERLTSAGGVTVLKQST
jgi:mannosyltransferase